MLYLKSRALSVILYLLDRANKDLVCFPNIKTISNDLNISISTTKLDITGKQTSNLYVINLDNIKNYTVVDKVEQVTEEKETLEIFENTENITDEKNTQQTKNMKQDINLKNIIENTEEIKIVDKQEDNITYKNIDKKISIFDILLKIINSNKFINAKNIKKLMLDKFKKLDKMKYVLKDYSLYISGLHPSSF